MVWDEGTYHERNSKTRQESEKAILKGMEKGHLTLILEGEKLRGEFALIRLKDSDQKSWLLVKKRDEFSSYADITRQNLSVKSGRSIQEIAQQAPSRGDVWLPARTQEPNSKGGGNKPQKIKKPPASLEPSDPVPEPIPEKFPHRNQMMLPATFKDIFDQVGWVFEYHYDGYRAIAEVENGTVRLYSKQFLNFNQKFPKLLTQLQKVHLSAVLDGEIVGEEEGESIFWVRDLLHLNGFNLRNLPLLERKKRLLELKLFNDAIRYCPHEANQGTAFSEKAASEGYSAVIARDAYSPYRGGTSKSWLKISIKRTSDADLSPRLTNLSKLYWPKDKLTKGDLIEYYRKIGSYLLPHLKDRPQSLHRHPDGIEREGFFQKDLIGHHPRWIQTERIYSESSDKSIDYLVCQNQATLLYMANLGCIELNPWLSRVGVLDRPDFAVIDLDPDDNDFSEVVEIAHQIHSVLSEIGAQHYCKTSGATGLHIYVPLQAKYDYETARNFALGVCQVVHRKNPQTTSLERSPAKRRGKIYLDCFQNAQGQTVAAVYSVRPREGAPVSAPVRWDELNSHFRPEVFTLQNFPDRLELLGDLWRSILDESIDIETCLLSLARKFPME